MQLKNCRIHSGFAHSGENLGQQSSSGNLVEAIPGCAMLRARAAQRAGKVTTPYQPVITLTRGPPVDRNTRVAPMDPTQGDILSLKCLPAFDNHQHPT